MLSYLKNKKSVCFLPWETHSLVFSSCQHAANHIMDMTRQALMIIFIMWLFHEWCSVGTSSPAWPKNPRSCLSLQTPSRQRASEQSKGTKMSSSTISAATAVSSPEIASHPSPHLMWSALTTLGHKPSCGRHTIIPCLQPIKSPCFHSWTWFLQPPSLGVQNPPRIALLK